MSSLRDVEIQAIAETHSEIDDDIDNLAAKVFDILADVADYYTRLIEQQEARLNQREIHQADDENREPEFIPTGLGDPISITVEGLRENLVMKRGL